MNHQQKAIRFAKTIKSKKTKAEKREAAHVVCEYCIAILADGYRKIGGKAAPDGRAGRFC